jgi:hypothetical protein
MTSNKEKITKALEHIYLLCPDAVVGGSISFISRGLLSRQPNDIDLFFPEYSSLVNFGLLNCYVDEIGSDTTTDINGKEIQRTSLKIMGVKVCAFKVEDPYLKHDILEYNGVKIKAQFPQYGIVAKKIYAEKNDKHKKDLEEILEKSNNKTYGGNK